MNPLAVHLKNKFEAEPQSYFHLSKHKLRRIVQSFSNPAFDNT